MLKLSPYTLLFSEEDKYYLYNGVSCFFSEISEELYIALRNRDWEQIKEDKDFLLDKQVILNDDELDDFFHDVKVKYMQRSFGSNNLELVIAPTTACNFDCPYCFEPKLNPKLMTKEVEDAVIEYIKKQKQAETLTLVWYGGEPLLAFDTIKRLFNRIKDECEKEIIHHEIITNGYLINDETIQFFKDSHLTSIQISLDGTEKNHDKTRCLKANKKGTFRKIQENIELLSKAIPDLSIMLRVNVNKSNYQDCIDIYEYYSSQDWQKNIFVYPGILHVDAKDNARYCQSCFDNNELHELYTLLHAGGVNVRFFPPMAGKGCMIQRAHSYIIGPEGEMYKCWDDVSNPEKVVGSLMDNKPRNRSLYLRYVNEIDPFDDACRKCHAFPICNGGCGHVKYRNKFENGEFDYCSPFRDLNILKKALLQSIQENPLKDKPMLQFL